MTQPRPDQLRGIAIRIGVVGERLAHNPDALLVLDETIRGLIGTGGEPNGRPAKGTVSDPTSRAALSDDEIRRRHRAYLAAVGDVQAGLETIVEAWEQFAPSASDVMARRRALASLHADDVEECGSHRAAGLFMVTDGRYKGRCRWCGDFRAAWEVDPVPELVRAYDRGERITDRLIARHMPKLAS